MASFPLPSKNAPSAKDAPATSGPIITELEFLNSPTSLRNPPPMKIRGALTDLLTGALLPCVPVVLVCTVLLVVIFHYRVDLDTGWELLRSPSSSDLTDQTAWSELAQLKASGGTSAYFIRFNPGLLVAITSWTGKIIPFLSSYSMALVAFVAGGRILNASKGNDTNQLPNPHQTSLLISLLAGSDVGPLWDVIKYRLQRSERLVQPVTVALAAFAFIVLNTFAIGSAETWFGAATQPVNQVIINRHDSPVFSYGRGLDPNYCGAETWEIYPCPSNPTLQCNYPCSITNWNFTTGSDGTLAKQGVAHAQEAAETLLGKSVTNQIRNASMAATTDNYGNYNNVQFYFLGDLSVGDDDVDFLTNTTSVATSCEVVTQNCSVDTNDEGFSCPWGYSSPSFTFSGKVGVDPAAATAPANESAVGIQFFKDAKLTQPIGNGARSTELFIAQNPIYFMHWSKGFPPMDSHTSTFDTMTNGGYLKTDSTGDNVFILNCSTTIYSTVYAWVNGTILSVNASQGWYPVQARDAYGAIYSAPFAIDSAEGRLALSDAAAIAAYGTTPDELADTFANAFSSAAVALTAGINMPVLNLLEQSRNDTALLTRVPKIPLYFLVSLKALYALFSLALAALVVAFGRPAESQQAKALLTVDGLAAGLFEPGERQDRAAGTVRTLYGEHDQTGGRGVEAVVDGATKRVGIRQTQSGGYVWALL